ncbi:MAG TPA: cyclopropane-fatty-acyl-phospholipid synthase family protein, partial [Streptosporangiaceae bacterium]|nr:cyclopropane-fatty-acyl-phospholipid synthase family protein [Streptosporangiaceae bacterium]
MTLAEVFEQVAGSDTPVEFHAYDGSSAGRTGSPPVTVTVRDKTAVTYLAQSPGALGLARAFVSGHLDVDGDMYTALSRLSGAQQIGVSLSDKLAILRGLGGPKLLYPRLAPPPQEVRVNRSWLSGRRHSRGRDASAISHHYDVSNTFYEWVLGPSMAYTCACYPTGDSTLEQAQENKFDLVARKIGLEPGMRLLDVGCGWGGMVMHAAQNYGVNALGITLSREQETLARQRVHDAGLEDQVEIRYCDYRELRSDQGERFDAISSIGMAEHVGAAAFSEYAGTLHKLLSGTGRLLNHQISMPDGASRARGGPSFIDRYIFPDGELQPVGNVVEVLERAGFEVRDVESLRENYHLTLLAWLKNLQASRAEAVELVGEERVR